MKRKFIFLAMMLLTIVGGVKWNVLNAQETITVGSGDYENSRFPFNSYNKYNYSQQIYTAADLANHGEGNITHIALHPSKANNYSITRNLTIYMQNTSKTEFASATDWETIDPQNEVFNGVVALPSGMEWFTIELNKKFNYIGENILLCILDNTGSSSGIYYYFKLNSSSGNGLSYTSDANLSPNSPYNGTIRNCTNYIQFTFEVNDGITPDVPTGLVAETIDHKSVYLMKFD